MEDLVEVISVPCEINVPIQSWLRGINVPALGGIGNEDPNVEINAPIQSWLGESITQYQHQWQSMIYNNKYYNQCPNMKPMRDKDLL